MLSTLFKMWGVGFGQTVPTGCDFYGLGALVRRTCQLLSAPHAVRLARQARVVVGADGEGKGGLVEVVVQAAGPGGGDAQGPQRTVDHRCKDETLRITACTHECVRTKQGDGMRGGCSEWCVCVCVCGFITPRCL